MRRAPTLADECFRAAFSYRRTHGAARRTNGSDGENRPKKVKQTGCAAAHLITQTFDEHNG